MNIIPRFITLSNVLDLHQHLLNLLSLHSIDKICIFFCTVHFFFRLCRSFHFNWLQSQERLRLIVRLVESYVGLRPKVTWKNQRRSICMLHCSRLGRMPCPSRKICSHDLVPSLMFDAFPVAECGRRVRSCR